MNKLLNTNMFLASLGSLLVNTSVFAAVEPEIKENSANTVIEKKEPDEGFKIETITVTSRKRSEMAIAVPLAISAFGAEDLKNRQIDSTDQISDITPNLQFGTNAPSSGHNSAATVFIRGVGQPDFIPASDPGVGIYVDGVYIARSIGSATELLDLERIEILRGPQGTLFGRNTIGGAVVLHTKRPSSEFGGTVGLRVGSDSRIEFEGDINFPVSEDFRLKMSLASRKRDGYVTNAITGEDLGDDNSLGFRIAAEWDVSDDINAYWTFESVHEDENGSPTVFNSLNTSGLFARLAAGTAGPPPVVPNFGDRGVADSTGANQICSLNNSAGANINNTGFTTDLVLSCGSAGSFDLGNAGPYKTYANGDTESKLDVRGTSLTLSADYDNFSVKSITAWRDTQYDVKRDADNTPLTILHSENHDKITQVSQEIQFTGDAFDDRASWVAGLYYFKESTDFENPVFLPALTVGALTNSGKLETTNLAAFGQLTYDITDVLNVTVGVRGTKEKKLATPDFYAIGNYNVPNPFSTVGLRCGGPGLVSINDATQAINRPDAHCIKLSDGDPLYSKTENELNFSQFTPMITVAYDLDNDDMIYVSHSEGFKSGGYSTRIIQPVPSAANPDGVSLLPSFEPEEAITIEFGYKSLYENFKFSSALFSTQYKNQHVVVRQGVAPITFNAGESTIQGFEVEGSWTPTSNWYVTGSLGYVKGEYDSFNGLLADRYNTTLVAFKAGTGPAPENVAGLVDLKDELAYTPKVTASLGISYLLDTSMGRFTPRLDWSYRGKVYYDAANSEAIAQDSLSLLNLAVTWKSVNEDWKATFAIKNLTDELYVTGGNISFSGSAYAESAYARPREWSLVVKRNF